MSKTNPVPDAWDDNWEDQVDNSSLQFSADSAAPDQNPEKKVSSRARKAQLRAQHAEFNRQLWAEAEAESGPPQMLHYLESRSSIPLKSEYKPAVKVLSRNPQSPGIDSAASALQRITISRRSDAPLDRDGEDGDKSDDETKKEQLTPEQRTAIAQREREEKQRKYEEARERLFGSPKVGSGASSPRSVTPPRQQSAGGEGRWKGKNRSTGNSRDRGGDKRESSTRSAKGKQLYDPNYTAKPTSGHAKKNNSRPQSQSRSQSQPMSLPPLNPIRSPRGPDGSGGFGFAQRSTGNENELR